MIQKESEKSRQNPARPAGGNASNLSKRILRSLVKIGQALLTDF
jgi:hypothetical protein